MQMVQSAEADIRPNPLMVNAVMAPLHGWYEKLILLHEHLTKDENLMLDVREWACLFIICTFSEVSK